MGTLRVLIRWAARGVGLTILGAVLTVVSVIAHLDTPVVRRFIVAQVNELVFAQLFRGEIRIDALAHLDPFGVSGATFNAKDPDGREVLLAEGVAARIATGALLRSLLRGGGDLVLELRDVRIDYVDTRLDRDEQGLALAAAFLPKSPATSEPSKLRVHLHAPRVNVARGWAHGQMARLPYFDGEVTDLDAAFSLDDRSVSVDARQGHVLARGIALGADAVGNFRGHVEIDQAVNVGGEIGWDGAVGKIRETLAFGVSHGRVDADLRVDEATAEALRSVWPASPVLGALTTEIHAHGPLESIAVTAQAGQGAATASVRGVFGWGEAKTARAHFDVVRADLHQITPVVDRSDLSIQGDVDLSLSPDGRLEGLADVDLAAGVVGKHRVPHATFKTTGFRERSGRFGGDATVVVEEPGAPTTLTLHAVPTGQSSSVDFALASHAVRMGALRRISTDATGNLRIVGKGNVDLERLKLDVMLDTQGERFSRGLLRVGTIAVQGHARGSLLNPDVNLALHVKDLSWKENELETVDVTVRGKALSPHVTLHEESRSFPSVDGSGDVEFLPDPTLRAAHFHLTHANESVTVNVHRIGVHGGAISVENGEVLGLGERATLSAMVKGTSARLEVHAPRLQLEKMAALLGAQELIRAGVLAVDADVKLDESAAKGSLKLLLEHGGGGSFDDVSAHFDGALTGRSLVGSAGVHAGQLGWLELTAKELTVGGHGPLKSASWREVWGDVSMKGQVDLEKLAAQQAEGLPVSAVRGRLTLNGRFERDSGSDVTPLIQLDAETDNLFVSGRAPTDAAGKPRTSWVIAGVDVTTGVRMNGDTGFVDVSARLHDSAGDLATLAMSSADVPYAAIYRTPVEAGALLQHVGFDAHVTVPRRAARTWPAPLRVAFLDGDVEGDAVVTGPLTDPRAVVTAKLGTVTTALTRLTSPLAVNLRSSYEHGNAIAELTVVESARELLTATANAEFDAREVLFGASPPAWRASAKAHVAELPLVTFGVLDDRQVRGTLSGDASVDDFHRDAKGRANLTVTALKVGDASYPDAKATVAADGQTAMANIRLDQSNGFGQLSATVPATWGAGTLPTPNPNKSLTLEIETRNFRAAALQPFLRGSLDQLDGLVDAKISMTVDPTNQSVHPEGTLEVRDGVFQLASFGGELHAIAAKASLTRDGALTLERLTASGVSGELLASASGRMNGLHLVAANAIVQIPKSRALPISVGGSTLGMIDGRLNISEALSADQKIVDIKVEVPSMHLLVPETGAQDVQALGTMPGVIVGTRSGPAGAFVPASADPDEEEAEPTATRVADAVPVRVVTSFGDDVSVRRGGDVRLDLSGGPTVTLTDRARVTGQVRLRAGKLNLYGKPFEIEQGTVTFVGDDPTNPQVSVTAGWSASDGTQVKADFVGPLKTGKVTLRSEPALSDNAIVQLLLFGSADAAQAASSSGAQAPGTSSAEGVAGTFATQPLNRALSQFGLSAVSAKVDTSSVNAKPEIEVEIAKNLAVAVAEIIGQPPVGASPDTTFLTVDWRFLRKWSLAATVGNADTTIVDLLWKYRY